MKNILIIAIVFVLLCKPCTAQNQVAELHKKFTIEREMSDKFFVFIANNKYGIINTAGKEILPAVYSRIYNSAYNLFVVSKDATLQMGVVNAGNTVVLPFVFDQVNILSPDRFHVLKNNIPVIVSIQNKFLSDTTDIPVTSYQYKDNEQIMEIVEAEPLQNEPASYYPDWYYNKDGVIYSVNNRDTVKTSFTNFYRLTSVDDDSLYVYETGGKRGLMNKNQVKYTDAIYEGLTGIYRSDLIDATINNQRNIYRFGNGKLKPVSVEPVSILEGFNNDSIAIVLVIRDYLGFGLLKSDGTYLLEPIKKTIFKQGESFFGIKDDSLGRTDIVDKHLRSILPPGTSFTGCVGNQFLITDTGKRMGVFHAAGYILIPPIYDELFFGNTDEEDNVCSQARKGTKWGLLNLQGNVMIPFIYDRMHLFQRGLCVVQKGKKWGVINSRNKTIVPFVYDHVADYFNRFDILTVQKNGLYGYVDNTGTPITPIVYEHADEEFEGGLSQVAINGKWGFINTSGKVIVPLEFDEVKPFYEDTTKVRKGDQWFSIDKKGITIQSTE